MKTKVKLLCRLVEPAKTFGICPYVEKKNKNKRLYASRIESPVLFVVFLPI